MIKNHYRIKYKDGIYLKYVTFFVPLHPKSNKKLHISCIVTQQDFKILKLTEIP